LPRQIPSRHELQRVLKARLSGRLWTAEAIDPDASETVVDEVPSSGQHNQETCSPRQYSVRMFRAYFDRSELGDPAEVLAVSGYLSAPEKWTEFEPAWQHALSEFGVETFHMTDFECRRSAFEGWEQARRTAFIVRLIDVIAAHAFVAIGAAINVGVLPRRAQRRANRLDVHAGDSGRDRGKRTITIMQEIAWRRLSIPITSSGL
jgi:hypothetical protein